VWELGPGAEATLRHRINVQSALRQLGARGSTCAVAAGGVTVLAWDMT
jgi:hypothetical protein